MEQLEDSEQVEIIVPETSVAPVQKQPSKKRLVILCSIAAVLVVIAGMTWVFRDTIFNLFAGQLTADVTETQKENKQEITDPELRRFITPTTGEVWYNEPKPMAAQGWFRSELASSYTPYEGLTIADQMAENAPIYKEVGKRGSNTVVLVEDRMVGGMAATYWLLEKRDSDVAILVKPQAGNYRDEALQHARESVTAKVTIFDETTKYDSLSIPTKIALSTGDVVKRQIYTTLNDVFAGGTPANDKLVQQLGASRLMKVETNYADTHLTNIGYYVTTPIGTKISVDYTPNTESLERYTFTNDATLTYKNYEGVELYDTIAAIARGCGGATAAVTRSELLKLSDLTKIGTTDAGRTVYEITNKNHDLYTKGYQEYKDTYGADAVSFSEYVKQHGLMVIQNEANELLVYVRGQYAMGGGCAKPVVYLYPTTPTVASVRVGADVTVSDPYYPNGGWKNVLARPNGTLTYNGQQYTSLFWEGTGVGAYPGVTSGVVVRRENAVSTIRQQLLAQGLRGQEVTDFLDFWTDKIPNAPYVRLTWLTQADIDTLAPLSVTPKPQTVIRAFLDMGGLSKPLLLQPQQFTAKPRLGFTVVEWGGLTSEIRH